MWEGRHAQMYAWSWGTILKPPDNCERRQPLVMNGHVTLCRWPRRMSCSWEWGVACATLSGSKSRRMI